MLVVYAYFNIPTNKELDIMNNEADLIKINDIVEDIVVKPRVSASYYNIITIFQVQIRLFSVLLCCAVYINILSLLSEVLDFSYHNTNAFGIIISLMGCFDIIGAFIQAN